MSSDSEKSGTFEWVADSAQLAELLSPQQLSLSVGVQAVDLGCGTSNLPLYLELAGYSVTAIDREAGCIEYMRASNPTSNVRWIACDVCDAAHQLPDACAQLVVDKGMLDCAIVSSVATELQTSGIL